MRPIPPMPGLVVLLLCAQAPAGLAGQPYITQTYCDTISATPFVVRIQFTVSNVSSWQQICNIELRPTEIPPPDSCAIQANGGPSSWGTFTVGETGAGVWGALPSGTCIGFGSTDGPFDVIITMPACCYHAVFAERGSMEAFYEEDICLSCAEAVPAHSLSWGRVKATYR
jgi:hypothetical protein